MIKPWRLNRGDKVAIVSLSNGILGEKQFIHKYYLAKERLERDYGLSVVVMPNALKGKEYLYKNPQARARDLMDAFRDSEIKAIFNAIGGDDSVRLLPYIDFNVIRDNPKIFTGYSDTTSNHLMMYKAGLVSYYGLALMTNISEYTGINEYTAASIEKTIFSPVNALDIPCSDFCSYETDKIWWGEKHMTEKTPRFPNGGYEILQGHGIVTGELLGGCIDVFTELYGTPIWPSKEQWKGKLLLIETGEENMSDDLLIRMLRNLCAQGVLNVINGIVVGKPAYREKYESYKEAYKKVVAFEAGLPYLPIIYNVNVGHAYPIGVFPLGLTYEINCDARTLRLTEPATCQ